MSQILDFDVIPCGGSNIVNTRPIFGWDSKSVICTSGHVIKVVSVATGECVHELRGHTGRVNTVILHPLNKYQILSASDDKTIIKWNYQDGIKVETYKTSYPIVALYGRCEQAPYLFATQQVSHQDFRLVSLNLSKKVDDSKHNKLSEKKLMTNLVGKENCVSIASNGEFVASVNNTSLTVYKFDGKTRKTHSHNKTCMRNDKKVAITLTCVVGHPVDDCVATGLSHGAILLWYNLFSDNPVQTEVHWHANAVLDLCFTTEGSYLLSGGSECVLVRWQTRTQDKEFAARLGSTVIGVTTSGDGTLYATAHSDNSIQVFGSNLKVVQHCQGLTMAFLEEQALVPVGLRLDPRTRALVTNGRPGHLQFYSLQMDKQLYNLDIIGQNYVSRVDTPMVLTELENLAFDARGDWMATNERRDDGETSMEMRLKFWQFDTKASEFKLNTLIDLPHYERVHTLRFRAQPSEKDPLMAVTTSSDGKFKLWSVVDNSDLYMKKVCWSCESVGFYRNLAAGPADFSSDGSLLAVGFGPTLTLWDPDTNALRHNFSVNSDIRHLEFGVGTSMGYLIISTQNKLLCWNILTCSVTWIQPWDVCVLVKSPVTEHMAAFTHTDTKHCHLNIFSPSKEKNLIYHKDVSIGSRSDVVSAIFVPRDVAGNYQDNTEHNLSWYNKCQLYFMNSSQDLLTLLFKEEHEDTSSMPVAIAENLPQTPFSLLLAKKREQRVGVGTSQVDIGQAGSLFLKEILSTPAHVQPPMTSLCKGFIESLLISKHSQIEESDDEEDKLVQPDSSDDSDMDTSEQAQQEDSRTSKQKVKKSSAQQEVNKSSDSKQEVLDSASLLSSDLKELTLDSEKLKEEFKKINLKQFNWMDSLL